MTSSNFAKLNMCSPDSRHANMRRIPCHTRRMVANERNSRLPMAMNCRSEEHTSELQSQSNLVCRLLLEEINDAHGHCAKRWRRSRPPRTRHCKSKGLRAAVCSRPTLGDSTGAAATETLAI